MADKIECYNCGNEIKESDNYCSKCHAKTAFLRDKLDKIHKKEEKSLDIKKIITIIVASIVIVILVNSSYIDGCFPCQILVTIVILISYAYYIRDVEATSKGRRKEKIEETTADQDSDELFSEDKLYEEAKNLARKHKVCSSSLLQRRLRIGYARAVRLMDMMEEDGLIEKADGARPRKYIGDDKK